MKHIGRPHGVPCAATLSFEAAQAILAAHAMPLGIEAVALAKAGRRVLAEPVRSAIDIPRYDAAAMDGFAVSNADLMTGRRRFTLRGAAYPGAPWQGEMGPGDTVRIMTGARMPGGADRVLMREAVTALDGTISLDGAVPTKPHVRLRGSDGLAGATLLPAGRVVDPRALVAAAAGDTARVSVWRRPRVAILATGDEVAPPGSADAVDGVPDSLSEALLLIARQWGGVPVGASLVPDRVASITSASAAVLGDVDVLVIVGGASRGDRDFAKTALVPLGLDIAFADVAIKPGKPVWYGRIGSKHVLGLPGNPTAAMTVARLFLAPLLTAIGGRGVEAALKWETSPLAGPIEANGERDAFLCAERVDDGIRVIARQSASAQCMLALADSLVHRRAGDPSAEKGVAVRFLRF